VREKGIPLFGPSPKPIIEPISKDEFIRSVKANAKAWRVWINDMRTRKSQAYAILTMCRALYTYKNGEQVSKQQAAVWAEQEFPEWSKLIQNALLWREAWRDENVDHDATFPETLRFVHLVISQFEKEAIRKAQELVNTYLPADRSLSDELIAERRMED
jgi:hypothetical protein